MKVKLFVTLTLSLLAIMLVMLPWVTAQEQIGQNSIPQQTSFALPPNEADQLAPTERTTSSNSQSEVIEFDYEPKFQTKNIANTSREQRSLNIELVTQMGGHTEDVAVQGRYAYMGLGPRLVVLDILDPTQPVKVGETPILDGIVIAVEVEGNYAYITDNPFWDSSIEEHVGGGLHIIDISDPTVPVEVGFYDSPGDEVPDVIVEGNYAYIADGDEGLRIIDITNSISPTEVGAYEIPTVNYYHRSLEIAMVGDTIYLASLDVLVAHSQGESLKKQNFSNFLNAQTT